MSSESSAASVAVVALATVLTLAATAARADTFKIIDERGRVQYTDRMPAESVNRGMTELNKQGMTKSVTGATLTPEQRRVGQEKAERQRQADLAAVRLRNQENALLSSYSSENDIDIAKRRNLALVGAGILSAEARINALEKRLPILEKEKMYYEKRPIPDKLKREIAAISIEIPKQHELIEAKNREALEVERKYSQQKARYRELKTQAIHDAANPKLQ
ncbi:MAG: hypothetical protein ABIS68_04045 [Casimicrobiaceae bacterium]